MIQLSDEERRNQVTDSYGWHHKWHPANKNFAPSTCQNSMGS